MDGDHDEVEDISWSEDSYSDDDEDANANKKNEDEKETEDEKENEDENENEKEAYLNRDQQAIATPRSRKEVSLNFSFF